MTSLEGRNHAEDCGLCLQEGNKREARSFCEKCKSYICDSCKDSHKKFQDLRNHTIVPSKTQQHDDSSGPSDLTTPFSQLSTQPSENSSAQRETSKPEDVTKDLSCKPSTSLSETQTISVSTPDKPGDSREAERSVKTFQKGINVLKNVNFHLTTRVNIRSLDEKHQSLISGCCFMLGGELLLCGSTVGKVKLFDSSFNSKYELQNLWGACDVAALNSNTAAVTVEKKIQLVNVSHSSLKMGHSIDVGKQCFGIDSAANHIYVCCYSYTKRDGEIRIYDFEGNLKKRVGKKLFSFMFEHPEHLSVSRSGVIFVTDYVNRSTINCLTDDGKIHFKYDDQPLLAEGLYADDTGDLIVCNRYTSTIIIITDSGTAYRTLLSSHDSIDKPHCVTYRPRDGTLVVGCADSDFLLVYKAS